MQVNYGGVATSRSPYRVFVSQPLNPSRVEVFGPGVEEGVKSRTPTHFNVDTREAGQGTTLYLLSSFSDVRVCNLLDNRPKDLDIQIWHKLNIRDLEHCQIIKLLCISKAWQILESRRIPVIWRVPETQNWISKTRRMPGCHCRYRILGGYPKLSRYPKLNG